METLVTITILNLALLGVLMLSQPLVRTLAGGLGYALSTLDERADEGIVARRLAMVVRNQVEALTLWTPAALIAQHASLSHPHLVLVGTAFLAARVTYTIISIIGIPVLRTASWIVGFFAWVYLVLLLWSAL